MPEISIKAETLFHLGNFPFTNAYLMSLISLIVILLLVVFLRKTINLIPGKLQSVVEVLAEKMLELMDNLLGSRKQSLRYFPIVATVFVFILVSNWLGLLPGVGTLVVHQNMVGEGIKDVPLFRSAAADLNFTLALAMISVLFVQIFGVMALGVRRHAGKFFNFKNPIYTFVGFLELVSEFVKIISFSFRLFGNIFAGEVLLGIVGFLVPFLIPLPFLFLEVFVGFIQAFIFTMLTLVFIAMSTAGHEEEYAH